MDQEKDIFKNKFFMFSLIVCVFLGSCYLIAFNVPIYMLIIPMIAIVLSFVFEKNDKIRKISVLIMLVSTVLIGGYCFVKFSHNNQFLKHGQYISGIASMGMETTDVKQLINTTINNNKKTIGKKVTLTCRIEDGGFYFGSEKKPQKTYKTVQELEGLLENINLDRVEIDFNYDDNRQFIENIEIVIFDPDGVIEKSLFQ